MNIYIKTSYPKLGSYSRRHKGRVFYGRNCPGGANAPPARQGPQSAGQMARVYYFLGYGVGVVVAGVVAAFAAMASSIFLVNRSSEPRSVLLTF